jgi:hypothetical protein
LQIVEEKTQQLRRAVRLGANTQDVGVQRVALEAEKLELEQFPHLKRQDPEHVVAQVQLSSEIKKRQTRKKATINSE